VNVIFFWIGEYLAKLQARVWLSHAWLSHAVCAPGQHTAKDDESARDNHVLASNFAKYSPILTFFTLTDSAINLSVNCYLWAYPFSSCVPCRAQTNRPSQRRGWAQAYISTPRRLCNRPIAGADNSRDQFLNGLNTVWRKQGWASAQISRSVEQYFIVTASCSAKSSREVWHFAVKIMRNSADKEAGVSDLQNIFKIPYEFS